MTKNRFIQNKTVSNNNDIARETVQAVFDTACSVLILWFFLWFWLWFSLLPPHSYLYLFLDLTPRLVTQIVEELCSLAGV
ncbi:hypothetical protein T07_3894 [Trichinella nelsoni]|uniref:Uncharacterized protein n=1 Tax=Trichinella nelsoni TaxID=6336 RepID=A0A0V0RBL1_9BILA|nr:hypothetical protein T07_3894 [Trichinella nelsoni]